MTTAVAPGPPPAPPILTAPAGPSFYRLSVAQYEQMIEEGILKNDDKVELIEGFLVKKMSKNGPHYTMTSKLDRAFLRVLPDGWFSGVEWPILLGRSVPEPGVMVLRGTIDDYASRKPAPADLAMLVEVADSSLADDRSRAPLFAEAGILIYWIANIPERKIEVYSDPAGNEYRSRKDHGSVDEVPVVIDGREIARLAVRDLLPAAEAAANPEAPR